MPSTTPVGPPDHATCPLCRLPNGPHSVIVNGDSLHDTCVDWTAHPFPGRTAGDDVRRTARRLRALAANLERAGAAFDRMTDAWPRAAVETMRRYYALRGGVHRAIQDATRGW